MSIVLSTPTDSLQHFLTQLQKAGQSVGVDLGVEEMADILWLAAQSDRLPVPSPVKPENIPQDDRSPESRPPSPSISPQKEPTVSVIPDSQIDSQTEATPTHRGDALPIQISAAKALRSQLELARALRPLMRRVPSRTQWQLDEATTATQTAECGFICPVFVPKPERWFDLAIVVEESQSLKIWQETIAELCSLVESVGAFRQVKIWRFVTDPEAWIKPEHPEHHLIWFISDCTSALWDESPIYRTLQKWGEKAPLVLIQLFPEKLWGRTALGLGTPLRFAASSPGLPVSALTPIGLDKTEEQTQSIKSPSVRFPVISLEPEPLKRWAKVTTGIPTAQVSGVHIDLRHLSLGAEDPLDDEIDDEAKVRLFSLSASLTARKLAGLMAAAPVSLPVVHLIQKTLLPESTQIHVAEVFMSGLIRSFPVPNQPDQKEYDFLSDTVRDRLSASVSIPQTLAVIEAISGHVSERLGLGTKSFRALIALSSTLNTDQQTQLRPFAELAIHTLEKLGSDYRTMAQTLKQRLRGNSPPPGKTWPPVLEELSVEIATVQVEEIVQFEFETAKIEKKPKSNKWVITKTTGTVWGYIETLTPHAQTEQERDSLIEIPMIEIKGGTFLMGSPKGEPESDSRERPQHEVRLGDFWIGQAPITQAQWRVVANYPPVNPDVEFKANPSSFKGDNNPVEQVNWYEAKEFCDRLSAATGKVYDLPTEAEWEYACRAGTTTPFSFGEMITTELANYDGNYPYNNGPKGEDRNKTTPVGTFPANAWGLYDMHGNVWEWCLDHWHDSYVDKPEELKQDGNAAWLSSDESKNRLLRGGSWLDYARLCRSACRLHYAPDFRDSYGGFRVVCRASRTL